MNRYHAPYAYDPDDPRNQDDDGYEEPLCPECGGPCRCPKPTPASRWAEIVAGARAFLATLPPELQALKPVVCAACRGTGWLTFTHEPYSKGFGHITEAIPCACRRKP